MFPTAPDKKGSDNLVATGPLGAIFNSKGGDVLALEVLEADLAIATPFLEAPEMAMDVLPPAQAPVGMMCNEVGLRERGKLRDRAAGHSAFRFDPWRGDIPRQYLQPRAECSEGS